MKGIRQSLFATVLQRREVGLLLLIGLVVGVVSFVDPRFLAADNLHELIVRCAPTAIIACGVMLIVITSEIDISVGSQMALLAAVLGLITSRNEASLHWSFGIAVTLLLGTAIGCITGALVAVGKVPSIIVTLGSLTALRGITTWMMGGENIDALPAPLSHAAKIGFGGFPVSVWVAVLVAAANWLLLQQTTLGRRLFAIGSSANSARMVGLSATRLKVFVFAYTGFLTAVATIVDVPRLPKIEAGLGAELEILIVTCVVVGGVSIAGGRGTLVGVLLAVVLMTLVRPVLTFLDVGEAGEKWTKAIQGLFIVLAMIGDNLIQRHARIAKSTRNVPARAKREVEL